MFDGNQLIQIKWHSHNKQHFISKGYQFTKIGDILQVKAKDLPLKSGMKVVCICDYCGKSFSTNYAVYNKSKERGKICCKNCKQQKSEESFLNKYGVNSPGASKECREKAQESMLNKYGHRFAMQTEIGQQHFKNTMKERFGVENPNFCPALSLKAKQAMYKNGTVSSSKPEQEMCKMLASLFGEENCFPSYPVDRTNLDCLLVVQGIKIDVEYDGWYWHKDKQDKDRKRNHWLISQGYKIIRILGNTKDILPSYDRLQEEVDYILAGHNIGYIDMND